MSTENVDSRVVQMKFDNKQFESGVAKSMSTLEKLKQRLKFTGATKGLEEVNKAANNMNLQPSIKGVETLQAKFSALDVIAVTALANITNSAMNFGKKIISALTIDPVKTGMDEYETKIGAIQTILTNTTSKGTTIDDVTKTLDELNTYADKTIYNFAEMTRNIGTFTAAGIGLEDSAASIQGIANLAAASGSTSQQAATAMYQLSQALSSGTVKLMDWNSVVNAGMGGELFREALKTTAREHGVAVDKIIEENGSFRDSLQEGWMSADILNETLKNFTTDGAEAYAKAMVESGKWTQKQADALLDQAVMMENAAQKVKTLSQLWSTLKETAQSGWAKSWELIIGDFYEAREMFTDISNFVGGIIDSMSNTRNAIIERVMGSPFKRLADQVLTTTTAIEGSISTIKDYATVVDEIINGDWGRGQDRWDKLTEAGYDWAHAQNLVNEKLGNSLRRQTDYVEGQETAVKAQQKSIVELAKMSDEQLKNAGYTEDQVAALRKLQEQAKKVGIPLSELVEHMDDLSGRALLLRAFTRIGRSIYSVIKAIGTAWRETFYGGASNEEILNKQVEFLYSLIQGFHKLAMQIDVNDKVIDKIVRTFKGLFAIIDIVTTITGGALKVALKTFAKLIMGVDVDVLSFTANVGDMIVSFRDWLFETNIVAKTVNKLFDNLPGAIKMIREWIDSFLGLPKVNKVLDVFNSKLDEFKNIADNIITGLEDGLKNGLHSVPKVVKDIALKLLQTIRDVLGIHSPSVEMYKIGSFSIEGFLNGFHDNALKVIDAVRGFGENVLNTLKNINWGSIAAVGVSAGLLLLVKNIVTIFDRLTAPMEGLGDLLSGTGEFMHESAKGIKKVLKGTANVLNAFAFSVRAKALKNIAVAIALLIGSLVLLTFIDQDKLWDSLKVLGVLAAILAGLIVVIQVAQIAAAKFGSGTISFGTIALMLVGLGLAALSMAKAIEKIGKLDPAEAKQGILGLSAVMLMVTGFVASSALLTNPILIENMKKLGSMMRNMALSVLTLVIAMKVIGTMSGEEMTKSALIVGGFVGVIAALTLITQLSKSKIKHLGKTLLLISTSMLIMVGVIKLIAGIPNEELIKGGIVILGFVGIMALLSMITKFSKKKIALLGATLFGISAAMVLLVGAIKIIGTASLSDIAKGGIVILAFVGIMALLAKIVNSLGKKIPKITMTLLGMSLAIAILAGTAILLGLIDLKGLAKGVIAISMLSVMMGIMIKATRGAKDVKGTIIGLAVAIALMAVSLAALSFIDPKRLASASAALSGVMLAMSLMIKATSGMKSKNALVGILGVVGILVALGTVLYILSSLPTESVLGSAGALSILLLSLSAMMLVIRAMRVTPKTLITLGVMALVIGALAGIVYLLGTNMDATSALQVAEGLSKLLLSLSAACLILTAVGAFGPSAFIGIGALVTLIAAITVLAVGIGALATHYPQLQEFLTTGISLLDQIGAGIGSFVGNMVGGFLAGASSNFETIGENLSLFMTSMKPFLADASKIDPKSMDGVKSMAEMVLILTGANLLDKLTSWLTGSSSMADFSEKIIPFGEAMVKFSETISGKIDSGAVEAAANAGKLMATMASEIPKTGGLIGWITGNKDLSGFGTQLSAFGDSIVAYSNSVSGKVDSKAIIDSVEAGSALVNMANDLPDSGGVEDWFMGDKNMGAFGDQLGFFGDGLKLFSQKVKGLGSVDAGVEAGRKVMDLGSSFNITNGFFTTNMTYFQSQLVAFASGIKAFGSETSDINYTKINATLESFKMMMDSLSTISNEGIDKLADVLSNAEDKISESIGSMLDGIHSALDKDSITFYSEGKKLVTTFAKGIKENAYRGRVEFETLVDKVVKKIKDKNLYSEFKKIGSRCVDGFVNGIKYNKYKAINQVKSMANEAITAAEKALDVNSPSRVFYGIGEFTSQGFINALKDSMPNVKTSSSAMAESAVRGMSKGLSGLSSLLGMDFDDQPTIKPVLDLSNVEAGVQTMGSMLAIKPSMRALTDVGSINTKMNVGGTVDNRDVVSAINKLDKTIRESAGDNISLGDVTYDDGSNINSAVKDLVRAAKVERRM